MHATYKFFQMHSLTMDVGFDWYIFAIACDTEIMVSSESLFRELLSNEQYEEECF